METKAVQLWIDGYLDAWRTNDPVRIGALFAADATYAFNPWEEPVQGRDAIVAAWLEETDEPGTWEATYRPLLVQDRTAIITGVTRYDDGKSYSNLFVVEFDEDGRCRAFTEWYMRRRSPAAGGT